MEVVGIAGAGTMGSAISALFANAGYEVVLYDISLTQASPFRAG
ncbi:MAG: 3-hydroxyacyl-CoA dehydrogenase NAD-binding domain-containing protein [Candidatus Methanoglobus sp.]